MRGSCSSWVLSFAMAAFCLGLQSKSLAAARPQQNGPSDAALPTDPKIRGIDADASQTAPTAGELADRIFRQEHEMIAAFDKYTPIIETYIQNVSLSESMGTVPKSDVYMLGQADFRGKVKVHSMITGGQKFSWNWSYVDKGFLQMIYIERGAFDRAHCKLTFARREFLGEVRCLVFDVDRAAKTKGTRFQGRIWVEDQDYTIVRINGWYSPGIHFSAKKFQDEYYLHFDSWRTNVKPGLWLPSYIYSQEFSRAKGPWNNPNFKSATHLWGYKLRKEGREEELSRLLVESANPVKDEAAGQDRSPLESEREWRHLAEKNILELLEGGGLLAPRGEVDKVLDTIVNNIEVTNGLDEQVELHCRVLLTSSLEMFSVGNTIVISRGLIDVVPNEEALAALLAHGMADAMLPKPYQDMYAFGDILRLGPTEILKRLSFAEGDAESIENSKKALELLKKSPYAAKLENAGLFLKQLQSQAKALRQLISPQLGNAVYFASELLQLAPSLEPANPKQIPALPLESRIKMDPWTGGLSLIKTKPTAMFSSRDKMPFEVTPMVPYLTRYVEASTLESNPSEIALFRP